MTTWTNPRARPSLRKTEVSPHIPGFFRPQFKQTSSLTPTSLPQEGQRMEPVRLLWNMTGTLSHAGDGHSSHLHRRFRRVGIAAGRLVLGRAPRIFDRRLLLGILVRIVQRLFPCGIIDRLAGIAVAAGVVGGPGGMDLGFSQGGSSCA